MQGKLTMIPDNDYKREIYDVKTWQQLHVSQLTYLRNLIIVLTTGLIALLYSDVGNSDGPRLLQGIVILPLFASLLCGILLASHESENYSRKYRMARQLLKGADISNEEKLCAKLEETNHKILTWQLWLFISGAMLMFINTLS